MQLRMPLFVASALLMAPVAAEAGWTATQTHTAGAGEQKKESTWFYDQGHIRVETMGQIMIVELKSGTMTLVNPKLKSYAQVTLDELVQKRDAQMASIKAQLPMMPPEQRTQVEAQLKKAEEAAAKVPVLNKTKKSDKVGSVACQIYQWTTAQGKGEACIASKVPVDVSGFRKDTTALAELMAKKRAGSAQASMAILQLGRYGFPMRMVETISMGARTLQITSEFKNLKKAKLSKAKFSAPKGFKKTTLEEMMKASFTPPPKGGKK